MLVDVKKPIVVDIKRVSIMAKVSDTLGVNLMSDTECYNYDGYVPTWFPEEGGHGDYLDFIIDIETGQILNWKKPSFEELSDFINEECDD